MLPRVAYRLNHIHLPSSIVVTKIVLCWHTCSSDPGFTLTSTRFEHCHNRRLLYQAIKLADRATDAKLAIHLSTCRYVSRHLAELPIAGCPSAVPQFQTAEIQLDNGLCSADCTLSVTIAGHALFVVPRAHDDVLLGLTCPLRD